jgi:hypothetical protein
MLYRQYLVDLELTAAGCQHNDLIHLRARGSSNSGNGSGAIGGSPRHRCRMQPDHVLASHGRTSERSAVDCAMLHSRARRRSVGTGAWQRHGSRPRGAPCGASSAPARGRRAGGHQRSAAGAPQPRGSTSPVATHSAIPTATPAPSARSMRPRHHHRWRCRWTQQPRWRP